MNELFNTDSCLHLRNSGLDKHRNSAATVRIITQIITKQQWK